MRGWVKSGLMQFILAIPLIAGGAPSHAEELKFGVAPGLGETDMRAELEPLLTYLSGALGRTVSLYIAKDDDDLRTQMEAGRWTSATSRPLAMWREPAVGGSGSLPSPSWTAPRRITR
jgi:ABC-type phosphate/phosphonate transport system substrate-binding protein